LKRNFNPIIAAEDDDLVILNGHLWSEMKYKLLGGYCDIFTRSMRKKWHQLIYIDLFAGPGYTIIQENGKILKSSPLIALSIPIPFDIYIFCDYEKDSISSLRKRVEKEFLDKKVEYLEGDVNYLVDKINQLIPSYSSENKVLTFCFADPFDLNLKFSTIRELSQNKLIDLLILQAYYMDANRNFFNYLKDNNSKISNYLDDPSWRDDFISGDLKAEEFVLYLAEKYKDKMKSIGYLEPRRNKIQIPIKNVPLYYLEFYSKNSRGNDFYEKVQYYADDQLSLNL